MTQHDLVVDLITLDGTARADVEVQVRPTTPGRLLRVGAEVATPEVLTETTDSSGQATFSLTATSVSGVEYEVSAEGARVVIVMPDEDVTLAAAIGLESGRSVLLPWHGWTVSEVEPGSPVAGDGWYRSSSGELRVFDGDGWELISGGEVDVSQFVLLADYNVHVGDIESDAQALEARVTTNENEIERRRLRTGQVTTSDHTIFDHFQDGTTISRAQVLAALNATWPLAEREDGDLVVLTTTGAGRLWALFIWRSPTWFSLVSQPVINNLQANNTGALDRVDANETAIAANTAAIAALQAGGSSAAGGLRHVEVPAIQHTTSFGLGDRVSNSVGAALYALDPPVEVGELVFVYQPDGDGDPDPNGWTIAVRVDDTTTTSAFTQSTQFLQILTAPMVGELETNTSFVSRLDALEAGGITVGTTAPTSPTDGELWFDPTNLQLHTYNADETRWEIVAASGDHERIDAVEVTAGQAAASAATNSAAIGTNVTDIGALTSRVSTLEAVDTSEQIVSPVEYNSEDHTLLLNHFDGTTEVVTLADPTEVETLTTTVDDVTILWYAGMGSETDIYERAAQASDGGDTPLPDLANDAVNGNVLRNTSEDFVAGLSWVGDGLNDGEAAFVLAKLNISGGPNQHFHHLFASFELAVSLQARASDTRVIVTPTGEASTFLDVPVAVGSGGVGDFVFGLQITDPSASNVRMTAAINGVAHSTTYTQIGALPNVHWSTRTNFMTEWETALQVQPGDDTNHLIGDAWDVIVGRKETPWSHTDFTALTSQTTTPADNRTMLYGDNFQVANAPIFSTGVHWSERTTMPFDRDANATVHHLRTYVPIDRATELFLDVAATRQTTHDPQTYLHLPDTGRLRRCFVDLGDDTVGATGSSADVVVDRAKLDEWMRDDRAVTVTQLRDAPVWQLCAGWPSNTFLQLDEFHTWAVCLVRANATDDGCPAGHANYLCVAGYIGQGPLGADERWIRLGVRT